MILINYENLGKILSAIFRVRTSSGTDNGDSKHFFNKVKKTSAFYLTSPETEISTIKKKSGHLVYYRYIYVHSS